MTRGDEEGKGEDAKGGEKKEVCEVSGVTCDGRSRITREKETREKR